MMVFEIKILPIAVISIFWVIPDSAYCIPLTKAIKNQVEIIQLSLTDDDGYIDYLEKL